MIYKKIDISQAAFCNITDELACEFIDHRLNIKAPLTQGSFNRSLIQATKCAALGISAGEAIEMAIDKSWRGIVFEYIKAELGRRKEAAGKSLVIAGPDNFIERATNRDWAH